MILGNLQLCTLLQICFKDACDQISHCCPKQFNPRKRNPGGMCWIYSSILAHELGVIEHCGEGSTTPFLIVRPAKSLLSMVISHYITGWWFGTFFIFPYILGMSSSQLTFTPSFFRGVAFQTTNQIISYIPKCQNAPIFAADFCSAKSQWLRFFGENLNRKPFDFPIKIMGFSGNFSNQSIENPLSTHQWKQRQICHSFSGWASEVAVLATTFLPYDLEDKKPLVETPEEVRWFFTVTRNGGISTFSILYHLYNLIYICIYIYIYPLWLWLTWRTGKWPIEIDGCTY